MHATPFGELPGSVVIDFAIIDAAAHAWDLSNSLGRPIEFDPEEIAVIAEVVAATCNEVAIEHGLIKPATEPPADATHTERLMSASGRAIAASSGPLDRSRVLTQSPMDLVGGRYREAQRATLPGRCRPAT